MPVITPAFPAMNCTCRGNEQMEMGRFLGCNEATNSRSFLVTRLKKLDIELIERFTLGVQSILTRMVLCFGKPASFGYSLHPVHYLILQGSIVVAVFQTSGAYLNQFGFSG